MSGKTINDPKPYKKGLSKEQRKKDFPDGTYVKVNGKVLIMKNNKPYFTNTSTSTSPKHSVCYGKKSILECPEDECVFHIKSKQCRLREYSSENVIKADKELRDKLKNKTEDNKTNQILNNEINYIKQTNNLYPVHKIKLLNILQQFIDNYDNEKEEDYIKKVLKKLNKLQEKYDKKVLSKLSFKNINLSNKYSSDSISNIFSKINK